MSKHYLTGLLPGCALIAATLIAATLIPATLLSAALLSATLLSTALFPTTLQAAPSGTFSFETVIELAREASARDHALPSMKLEGDFAELDYDQYRDIRFRQDKAFAVPGTDDFRMDLMPPGFYFTVPVSVSLVADDAVEPIPFTLDLFDFGPLAPQPPNPQDLGFSGFRLRHPINSPDVLDEVAVFQGASYFRAVAQDLLYGLSARGLAIDTASEEGEEFPVFTRFWIGGSPPEAPAATVYALLESPSVTGAYKFIIEPGAETTMDIESVLFPRRDLDNVGIAPLTSMFLFNTTNRSRFDDYRNAVHDSDGVQMINGQGERIWRSLANPRELQISTFIDENPVGFGLVQRHRHFADFEDAEAHYEKRPSTWVEPRGDWGKGAVVLVEIPTELEIHDNIAAYWRPARVLKAGQEYRYAYRLGWNATPADDKPLMRIDDVRIGKRVLGTIREIVVDYSVPETLSGEVEPQVAASNGKISNVFGQRLPGGAGYRVSFGFDPGDATSSELRLQLHDDTGVASETWLYRWTP